MMKRYVRELANDILCRNFPEEKKKQIEKAVSLCERGMITSCEAAKLILEIHYNDWNNEFNKEEQNMKQDNIEKPWYTENWYDDDLRNALEEAGITVSDENVERLKEVCRNAFDDKTARNEMLVDLAMGIFG